jgi:hypothetical protein
MKTKFIIFILSLAICAFSQNSEAIKQIKSEYLIIKKSIRNYKIDSMELMGESSEGGFGKYYKDSTGEIRLIIVKYYGEMGNKYEEYYYNKSNLFFVLSTLVSYNVPFYMTKETAKENNSEEFDPKKSKLEENRYYFENGSLILWLGPDKKPIEKSKYKEIAESIIIKSKEYKGKTK